MRRAAAVLGMGAVLAACGHGEPFAVPGQGASEPLVSIGYPSRLTYNRGHDQEASWLPDGSGFLYTAEQYRFAEGDWCTADLPPAGGRARRMQCARGGLAGDSVNAYRWAAAGPDGRVAFLRLSAPRGQLSPRYGELVVGTFGAPDQAQVVTPVPYTLSPAPPHGGVAYIRWLDDARFVYRGDLVGYVRPCQGCAFDTIPTGRNLVLVQLTPAGATRTLLPGTDYASSVAVRGPDEILFTRGGDRRVISLRLSTGDTATVWTFSGVARGLAVAGDRLIAVVGGSVSFDFDQAFGDSVQRDNGGFLRIVDLAAGTSGVVDQFGVYRQPALSPDGKRLVVESVARAPDLYLFDLP